MGSGIQGSKGPEKGLTDLEGQSAEIRTPVRFRTGPLFVGVVAQLEERLPCKQEVAGAEPVGSTSFIKIKTNKIIGR